MFPLAETRRGLSLGIRLHLQLHVRHVCADASDSLRCLDGNRPARSGLRSRWPESMRGWRPCNAPSFQRSNPPPPPPVPPAEDSHAVSRMAAEHGADLQLPVREGAQHRCRGENAVQALGGSPSTGTSTKLPSISLSPQASEACGQDLHASVSVSKLKAPQHRGHTAECTSS